MAQEYWWLSGDTLNLKAVYPAVAQTLRACKGYCNNKWGLMSIHSWNLFDWADIDYNHDLVTHNNLLLVAAIDRAIDMATALHKKDDIKEWQNFKKRLIKNINKYLWSDELGGYIDSIHNDGIPSKTISQQANTLALLYDVAPPERDARIQAYLIHPPKNMVKFGTPFSMFFLLEELGKEGHYGELLRVIRDRWGFMLDAGATTFWESFPGLRKDVPTRSYCHGWSAAPTYFLTRYQLGVVPLEPGYHKALIAPNPADLSWAKGRVPTPYGEIEVDWKKEKEEFRLDVTLPEEITGVVHLPVKPKHKPVLLVNGKEVSKRDKTIRILKGKYFWALEIQGGKKIQLVAKNRR